MPKTKNPNDYLVVEDREQSSTWHLQVSMNGTPDHRLMGAAWAALHEGYRGSKYEGPKKQDALRKLKRMYKREKMPLPGSAKSIIDAPELRGAAAQCCANCKYAQWINGTGDLICSKFEFETEADFVCDSFEKIELYPTLEDAAPAEAEPMAEGEMSEEKSADVVLMGDEVKALGDGKLGGYLVRFGGKDLTGVDWFDQSTDFGPHRTSLVYYHHGLDGVLKRRVLDDGAVLRADDVGVWIETQLKMRDEYERAIYNMAQKGKLGWSSGTASHLVERDDVTGMIKRWPLGLDASLTPTPAEPRNHAVPIKSLVNQPLQLSDESETAQENRSTPSAGEAAASDQNQSAVHGEIEMSDDTLNEIKGLITAQGDKIAALENVIKNAPPVPTVAAAEVKVTRDPADVSYKTLYPNAPFGHFLQDVRKNALNGTVTPQLKAILGSNESIPAEGGFLVQTDQALTVEKRMYEVGQLMSRCDNATISAGANSVDFYGRDEDSRANGSRYGGITAYRVAEAATITASGAMNFYKYTLKPKEYAAIYYATNDVLQDTALLEGEVMDAVPAELSFMVEDDIVNGLGVAGCLGFANSAALVSVTKEVGQAADTIVYRNVNKMWSRMWAPSRANAVWLINQDIEPQLEEMSVPVGTGGSAVFQPVGGASASPYATLKGRPIIPVEYAATLGDKKDIMLVDLSQYKLATKGGLQQAQSIHVQFLTNQMAFRFIMRYDGQPKWKNPLTPYKSAATLSPFVTLDARA